MTNPFYWSETWRKLRRLKLQHNSLCQDCFDAGILRPATTVDHVRAIRDGGAPLALENLRSLCQACHSVKTDAIDGGFGRAPKDHVPVRGCDARGRPLDPRHPWHTGGKNPLRSKSENHGMPAAHNRRRTVAQS
jgi:5-methylcytosine-specific restriction protein A